MLTKEECLEALTEIKMYGSINIPLYSLEVIENLIGEHFSNPPLKFEELKPNMWVWDNAIKEWVKVEAQRETYTKIIECWVIGWVLLKTYEFEPNRFYRKEVVQK